MAADSEPVSGKYACVQVSGGTTIGGDEITGWSYNQTHEDRTYASCATDGKRKRVDGHEDLTGQFTVLKRTDSSFRNEITLGANIILWLFHRKPMSGISGLYDEIPAKVLGISGGASISEGGEQEWTVSFGMQTTDTNPEPLFDQTAAALL